jgi:ubiquinone/menaquinone biosynthesis C-methylase UbiE
MGTIQGSMFKKDTTRATMNILVMKFADNRRADSLATKLRRKRFALFNSLLSSLPRPLRILDIGGTQLFWERMGFTAQSDVKIVLLNLTNVPLTYPNFRSVIGDARNMGEFRDKEYDVVFSNSVIEHVGDYGQQRQMAEEVRRVGRRYFLQTPNRSFPVEPHFLFPFFQFLPLRFRVFLIFHFDLGWYQRIPDKQKATETVSSIRLLTERELRELFPGAMIYREKFFGMTKSFIVYDGWGNIPPNTT